MRKLLMIPVVAFAFASCGGGSDKCDPATAEGAAKCICEMGEIDKEEDKDKAEEKMTELMKKMPWQKCPLTSALNTNHLRISKGAEPVLKK